MSRCCLFTCGPIGDRRSIDRPSLCDAHHDYDYDHNKSDSTGSYPERRSLINYTGYAELASLPPWQCRTQS